jgi:SNF2 family DNA or RNA helicase
MFVSSDTRHIITEWREDLASVIPDARVFDYKGEKRLLLPNTQDVAKVARNIGVAVPPPILTRYNWPGRRAAWAVQKVTAALLTESPRAYTLNDIGCGKTASAIFAADYLRRHDGVKRVLIAAPLSTLSLVWEAEIFSVLPQARVVVVYGSREQRLKLLAKDADYYVINHHGLPMLHNELAARGFDILVLDELAVFRTKGTELWKAANRIISEPSIRYVWGLTGSPRPKAPTDAWGQMKLLTPSRTTNTLRRFQDLTMRQVSNFKWVERPEANTIIAEQMQPSVRFTRDDVQELPPTTYVTREVKLEPEAARAYKLLFDKMVMLTQTGQTITAVNEGVLRTKLMQVACGYIYTDKHKVFVLPNQARLNALHGAVNETSRKVIVFVPYVHALEGIAKYLDKQKESVALVHGGTSSAARNRIFRAFQTEDKPRVLVAHPQCMAHGLTLTAANTIVWYSAIDSYEIYEQANGRIVRPSQTSKTLIVHLAGTPVEKASYTRLKQRASFQGMLLELFRNQEVTY